MNKTETFSPEVQERAVRIMEEHRQDYPSQWSAIESIAGKIGCSATTLLKWVRRHEVGLPVLIEVRIFIKTARKRQGVTP